MTVETLKNFCQAFEKGINLRNEPRVAFSAAWYYLIRAGCPGRLLPKDFPSFTTVQNRFHAWRDSGSWMQISGIFMIDAGEAEGREAEPIAVAVDSQSVRTTEAGESRGYDAGKKIKGRKRQIAADMLGLPIEYQIAPANIQNRNTLPRFLAAVHRKKHVGENVSRIHYDRQAVR